MGFISLRRPAGTVFIDGEEVAETRQCVHCGRHWLWRKGSGKKRGWCMNCSGVTCGKPACMRCDPLERKLERWEKAQNGHPRSQGEL